MMSNVLDMAVFPGTQGGPLEHVIAAKAVAYHEALSDDYLKYCVQVVKNAATMADAFKGLGYNIVSNGTDNHMFLIDLRNKNLTGKDALAALEKVNITVNKNMVPFDDKSAFVTSGIRIGSAAITTRGLKEKDCIKIVDLLDQVLMKRESDSELAKIKKKVNVMMTKHPLFKS